LGDHAREGTHNKEDKCSKQKGDLLYQKKENHMKYGGGGKGEDARGRIKKTSSSRLEEWKKKRKAGSSVSKEYQEENWSNE